MFRNKYAGMPLEEKRKLYVCGNNYVCLNDIPLWPVLYRKVKAPLPPPPKRSHSGIASSVKGLTSQPSNKVRAAKARQRGRSFDGVQDDYNYHEEPVSAYPLTDKLGRDDMINEEINNKVSLWQGDITRLEIDCIIHGTNTNLRSDRGSETASLYKIAGPTLLKECMSLNGCEIGDAKITAGHKLPAKFIIHTAGPTGKTQQSHLLQSCYERCLQVALENNIKSLAFCCISTGLSGYPNREAAEIALKTVRKWLLKNSDKIDRIIFCTFLSRDFQIYQRLMTNKYFPCESKERPLDMNVVNNNNNNNNNQSFEDTKDPDDPMTLKRSDSGIVGFGGNEKGERIKGRSKDDNDINVKKKKSCKLRRLASARRSTVSSENKKIDFRELQARLGRDTPPERPHSRTSSFERPSLEKRPSFRRAPPKIVRRVEINESSDDEGIIEDVALSTKAGSTDTSDHSKPPSEVDSVEADTSECDVYVDESCDSQSIASSTTEDNMRLNAGDHEPDNHHLSTYNQNNSDAHSNGHSNLLNNHHNNTHHYNSVTKKDDLSKTIRYQPNHLHNNDTSNNNNYNTINTHTINNDYKDELNNTLKSRDNQHCGVNNNQNDGDKVIEKNSLVVNAVTNNKQRVDDIKEVNVQSKTRYASNHILNDYARERIEIDIDIVGIPTTYSRERLDSDTEVNHMNLADELNDILSNNEMEEYPDSLTSSTTSLEDSTARTRNSGVIENDVLSKLTSKANGFVEEDIFSIGGKTKIATLDKYEHSTTNAYGIEVSNGFNGYAEKNVYNVTKENDKDDILNGIETSDYKDEDIYSMKEMNADSGIEEQLVPNGFEKEMKYMKNILNKDKPYEIEGNLKSGYNGFRSDYTNGLDSMSSSTDNGFSGSDDSVNSDTDSKPTYLLNEHCEDSQTKGSENDVDMYLSSSKSDENKEEIVEEKYEFKSEATNENESQDIHTIPEMDEFLDGNRSSISNGFGHDTSGGFIDDDVFSIAMGSAAQTVETTEKVETTESFVSTNTSSYDMKEDKEDVAIPSVVEEMKCEKEEVKSEVSCYDYSEQLRPLNDITSDYKFESETEKIDEEKTLYVTNDIDSNENLFVSSEEKEELIENNKDQTVTAKDTKEESNAFEASNFSDYLSGAGKFENEEDIEEEEIESDSDDELNKENIYKSSTESIDKNIYPILETNEVAENDEEEEVKDELKMCEEAQLNGFDQTKDEVVTESFKENKFEKDTVLDNTHEEPQLINELSEKKEEHTNEHIEESSIEKEQTVINEDKEESTLLNVQKAEEIINGHVEEAVITNEDSSAIHTVDLPLTNDLKEDLPLTNGHKEDKSLSNGHKEELFLSNEKKEELTNGTIEEKPETDKKDELSSTKSISTGVSEFKDKYSSGYTKSCSLSNLASEPAQNGKLDTTKVNDKYSFLTSKSSSLSTSDLSSSRYSTPSYSNYSNGSSSYSLDKYKSSAYSSYSSSYTSSKYDTNTKSYSDYKDRYSSDSSSLTSKYGSSSYGSSYSDYKSKSSYSSLSDSSSALSGLRSSYGSSYADYSSRSTSDYGSYSSKYSSSYNKYSSTSRIADVLNKYDSSSTKRY